MSGHGLDVETLPLFAAARRTDPPTSHAAAARVPAFRSGHHRAILEALAAGRVERTGREVKSASGAGESEYRVTRQPR